MANPHVSRAQIEDEVKKALAATLRLEESAVGLDKSIMNDLGATSIDFLDINFRLENAFGIQLATQLLLDHVEEVLGEGVAIDKNNQITDGAARLLKLYLGERPGLEAGMYADEVATLVTPMVLVKSVEGITNELPEACTHCSAKAYKSEDGMKVVCGECGKDAEYPDGDTLTQKWIREVEAEHKFFSAA
jgi:acyl carrier protein